MIGCIYKYISIFVVHLRHCANTITIQVYIRDDCSLLSSRNIHSIEALVNERTVQVVEWHTRIPIQDSTTCPKCTLFNSLSLNHRQKSMENSVKWAFASSNFFSTQFSWRQLFWAATEIARSKWVKRDHGKCVRASGVAQQWNGLCCRMENVDVKLTNANKPLY